MAHFAIAFRDTARWLASLICGGGRRASGWRGQSFIWTTRLCHLQRSHSLRAHNTLARPMDFLADLLWRLPPGRSDLPAMQSKAFALELVVRGSMRRGCFARFVFCVSCPAAGDDRCRDMAHFAIAFRDTARWVASLICGGGRRASGWRGQSFIWTTRLCHLQRPHPLRAHNTVARPMDFLADLLWRLPSGRSELPAMQPKTFALALVSRGSMRRSCLACLFCALRVLRIVPSCR
jgi:hypothetical protein